MANHKTSGGDNGGAFCRCAICKARNVAAQVYNIIWVWSVVVEFVVFAHNIDYCYVVLS